jgi:hypothetical protein
MKPLEAITQALDIIQGRAKARTLTPEQVLEVAQRAARAGWATTGRAKVAASYDYVAMSTAADAVRVGDYVHVYLDRESSKKSSPVELSKMQPRWRLETRAAMAARGGRQSPELRLSVRSLRAGRAGSAERATRDALRQAQEVLDA